MTSTPELDELVRFIVSHGHLSDSQAAHLVEEVLAFLNEPVSDYVQRRHIELQRDALSNEQIYRLLAAEVRQRPFASRPLSVRQIRRIIYGG